MGYPDTISRPQGPESTNLPAQRPLITAEKTSDSYPAAVPYRMTEANDCLHGVHSASDGFAEALWALDYMHWWAAHRMAGANFHNNPWIPTDTIVPDPSP